MTLTLQAPPVHRSPPAAGLRVAQVTEYYYPHLGGVCEHAHFLADECRRRGMHVDIITPRIGRTVPLPGVIHVGHSLPVPSNGSHARLSVGWRLRDRLRHVLREGRYDVVHVHAPLTPSLPLLALERGNAALVGTWHTQFSGSLLLELFRDRLQSRIDRLDGTIAVSETARAAISRYFEAPWRVVPNGVNTTLYRPGRPMPEEMAHGAPTLLFVGRLDPRNGLSTLLEAWPIVQAAVRHARLVIVGDGPLRGHYERQARALSGVVFRGALGDERADYYSNASAYVCPTTRASFGITLLEAMASGRPILCSDIPGFRDVVANGREALMVPPEDPRALAQGAITLLRDAALRDELGATGLQRSARYDWVHVTDEIVDVYASALAARRAAG
ncbi:MAG: glycosyltransferase family 4 protein [Gemmatimonadetes bacterium]|nr:glycosyltransferase family 4 protein [Gemmatimonadota bacterium]